jgi:hypothetical protein
MVTESRMILRFFRFKNGSLWAPTGSSRNRLLSSKSARGDVPNEDPTSQETIRGKIKGATKGGIKERVETMRDKLGDKQGGDFHSAWDDLWKDGLTPWDLGRPTPLLVTELREMRRQQTELGRLDGMKILVPGCGNGYDLVTLVDHQDELCQAGLISNPEQSVIIGLDISPTSLDHAKQHLLDENIEQRETQVKLKCGNFFESSSSWGTVFDSIANDPSDSIVNYEKDMQFDLIVDYTFFCALRPNMREAWGKRMKDLLLPMTGRLLTIIYPILPGEDVTRGPPYPVAVKDYRKVLEPMGIQMESEPFQSPDTVPSRAGKELVCYWKTTND